MTDKLKPCPFCGSDDVKLNANLEWDLGPSDLKRFGPRVIAEKNAELIAKGSERFCEENPDIFEVLEWYPRIGVKCLSCCASSKGYGTACESQKAWNQRIKRYEVPSLPCPFCASVPDIGYDTTSNACASCGAFPPYIEGVHWDVRVEIEIVTQSEDWADDNSGVLVRTEK